MDADLKLRVERLTDAVMPWVYAINNYDEGYTHDSVDLVEATMPLVASMRTLVDALNELELYAAPNLDKLYPKLRFVRNAVLDETVRHLSNHYSDSDTDAPCDIEWDLAHLIREINPDQPLWMSMNEILPAYVRDTIYPTPVP